MPGFLLQSTAEQIYFVVICVINLFRNSDPYAWKKIWLSCLFPLSHFAYLFFSANAEYQFQSCWGQKVEAFFSFIITWHCLFNFTFHLRVLKCIYININKCALCNKYVDSASNWMAREYLRLIFRSFLIPYSNFFFFTLCARITSVSFVHGA